MRRTVLPFAAIALLPVSLFAVDGQVLINQAVVNASGGFPYVISQADSYKLSGNLIVTTIKDAIVINHDDVSLDLNGLALIGSGEFVTNPAGCEPGGSAQHCAVVNAISSFQNITIKNGSIRGFADGGIPVRLPARFRCAHHEEPGGDCVSASRVEECMLAGSRSFSACTTTNGPQNAKEHLQQTTNKQGRIRL